MNPDEEKQLVEKAIAESAEQRELSLLKAELEAAKTLLASLEVENNELKQENWELKIDPRTGLERERRYYENLNQKIEAILENTEIAQVLEKDSLAEADLQKLDAVPLSVTSADLGYLSKYNEDPEITEHYGEHAGGDAILTETGKVIQQADTAKRDIRPKLDTETRGYRVGGDEFAMIHERVKEEAKQVALEFTLKQGEIKIKGADLPPMINCGTASLREAVEAFVAVITKEERQNLTSEEKAKKIQELLTSIADRRSKVAKGIERLTTMTHLLAREPEKFRRNHRWLQKGAFGMVENDFAELIKLVDSPEAEKAIRDLVKEKLEVERNEEEDQKLKERAIVVKISDRDFLS